MEALLYLFNSISRVEIGSPVHCLVVWGLCPDFLTCDVCDHLPPLLSLSLKALILFESVTKDDIQFLCCRIICESSEV